LILRKDFNIDAYVISDIGIMCSKNEDSCLLAYSLSPDLKLFLAVTDGVRNNSVPEIASKLVLEKLKEYHINRELIFESNAEHKKYRDFIVNAIKEVNSYILSLSERVKSYSGMASTLASLSITNSNSFIGLSVGDSSIFLLRGKRFSKICGSKKINLLKEPSKNVIGVSSDLIFELREFKIKRGDKFIVTTDGATDYPAFNEQAKKILQENINPVNICNALVREAISNKVNDNITVGVVVVK